MCIAPIKATQPAQPSEADMLIEILEISNKAKDNLEKPNRELGVIFSGDNADLAKQALKKLLNFLEKPLVNKNSEYSGDQMECEIKTIRDNWIESDATEFLGSSLDLLFLISNFEIDKFINLTSYLRTDKQIVAKDSDVYTLLKAINGYTSNLDAEIKNAILCDFIKQGGLDEENSTKKTTLLIKCVLKCFGPVATGIMQEILSSKKSNMYNFLDEEKKMWQSIFANQDYILTEEDKQHIKKYFKNNSIDIDTNNITFVAQTPVTNIVKVCINQKTYIVKFRKEGYTKDSIKADRKKFWREMYGGFAKNAVNLIKEEYLEAIDLKKEAENIQAIAHLYSTKATTADKRLLLVPIKLASKEGIGFTKEAILYILCVEPTYPIH